MKNRKSYYSITAIISILLIAVGCERDLDGLELASYPTTPEVFIDGFSTGLYYSAYGTSNVYAFDVDYNVKYKGSASMSFAVPDTSNPNGSYVGGVFGTNPGRDLSGYNVLTFWAKASQPAVLNEVGFGNDMGESKYKVTLTNMTVNSNWMKYYVPIPDPSVLKQERGMFFYAAAPQNGRGYTFWIDEMQFENLGTIAHKSAEILNGQDFIKDGAETDEVFQITDCYTTVNLPTGIDQKVSVAPSYFKFTSSNPSVATVDNFGKVTVVGIGTAAIIAKLGDLVTNGSITIIGIGQSPKPAGPAPTPTVSSNNVISLFSNAYTNVTVDTWNTHWLYSTAENEDIQIEGDDVIRYRNLNFVGIEFTSQQINASAMNSFHIDLWTPEATSGKTFKIMLVDFGADGAYGGDDDSSSEVSIASPPLTSQNWVSLNIPMSNFAGLTSRTHLAQLVLSGDLPTVYIDNVYFFNSGTAPSEPTTAAPVPSFSADDVLSVFSDSYTNLTGTDFNPYWEQTTIVTQVAVAGNNTLKYTGLDYQGIQLGGSQNITAMNYLHLDFWTATSTSLSVYLISSGPVETPKVLNVPTSGWTSVDIPLSEFSPVDLSDIIQFKFVGNGDIYIDNILFHK